jgi:hypothetical protein
VTDTPTDTDIPTPDDQQGDGFPREVITAFVVALTPDGRWIGAGMPSLLAPDMVLEREAHLGDLIAGGNMVAIDADRQVTLNQLAGTIPAAVIGAQMQMANQMRQQAETQRIVQKLEASGQGKLFGIDGSPLG